MTYDPTIPYNDLPLLPPKVDVETKKVLKKALATSRALAELKGALTNLPNPNLFIDTIQLQEAQASSAIENIITTQDQLFKASISNNFHDAATKEVIHYKNALWFGLKEIERRPVLTTNLFIKIVQIIKANQSGIRNVLGTQLKNPLTGEVVYTPPVGEEILRQKLHNLETFIHGYEDIDALIKLPLIHYQFEAIHPFFDGNGRTGRILILLYLKYSGLLDLPAIYVSKFINQTKGEYYAKLRGVTEHQDWESWILYLFHTIEMAANDAQTKIYTINDAMNKMGQKIRQKLPRIYSKDLLEALFHLPYTKRKNLVSKGLGASKTVGNYLNRLEEHGFLVSEQVGKEKLYLNRGLMEILRQ